MITHSCCSFYFHQWVSSFVPFDAQKETFSNIGIKISIGLKKFVPKWIVINFFSDKIANMHYNNVTYRESSLLCRTICFLSYVMSGYELSQYLEIWIDRSGFVSYNDFEQNI